MRADSGFCDATRKGEGEALGFKPAEILAADRKADLAAAKEAMAVAQVLIQVVCESADYRDRALPGFKLSALPHTLLFFFMNKITFFLK